MPPLFAMEDGAETPLGAMEIDGELRALFSGETGGAADRHADNTVEVLLPMVKYFFPRAKLLWVRLPADPASFEAGKILARCARTLGRDLKALGSTDLTHYGANYGFSPRGSGREALDWVKTVNDRRFIEAVLEGNPGAALARAEGEKSACSAGAALGCLGFAAESAARAADAGTAPAGELLAYGTSADRAEDGECPDSFVGYAAIRWG
jgi:AmmeMemoRadiSam system protein B